jgi:hypothetical protein
MTCVHLEYIKIFIKFNQRFTDFSVQLTILH